MKIGMTLALVSGILTLLFGFVIIFIVGAVGAGAGAMGASGIAAKSGLMALILLGLPIMVIVGGAMAHSNPKAATFLTGIPGLIIALTGLIGMEFNILVISLGAMMLAAAWFIYNGAKSATKIGGSQG